MATVPSNFPDLSPPSRSPLSSLSLSRTSISVAMRSPLDLIASTLTPAPSESVPLIAVSSVMTNARSPCTRTSDVELKVATVPSNFAFSPSSFSCFSSLSTFILVATRAPPAETSAFTSTPASSDRVPFNLVSPSMTNVMSPSINVSVVELKPATVPSNSIFSSPLTLVARSLPSD